MTRLTVKIPEIHTDRMVLRAPAEADLDRVAAFFTSERSHIIGGPFTRSESWKFISGSLGHWILRGYGFWHIHHKEDGRMIGACGFINREGWDEPELGWHLHDGYEGKGYAFEAVTAARHYGATMFGLDAPISYIAPDNDRSRALAKRLGATFEREGNLLGHNVHVYRHPSIKEAR